MITYVDTSTFVKLFIDEPGTANARAIWEEAQDIASVALIRVEARSALARARRNGRVTAGRHARFREVFDDWLGDIVLLGVGEMLLARAGELAELFRLRAYDAVHLAAAELCGAEVLSSADQALCAAARDLSFHVSNPLDT